MWITGNSYQGVTIAYSIIWSYILFYFLVRLFKEIFILEKYHAVMASLFIMCFPIILRNYKEYMLDLQLIALVVASSLYVFKYIKKESRSYLLKISAISIIGFMTKQSYLIFATAIYISLFIYSGITTLCHNTSDFQ
ncbi:glycosyltransferase family 39 protein [Xenorhabdus sp. 18]|uniref:glycosyltransferase family 39 protein n=1 Tax=Xenorhabdus doucetiae TaxID=351671 RepID=UPI0019B09F67|nr:glycosyltransferase family 39 protein [Xenorhabdus sp. 18]